MTDDPGYADNRARWEELVPVHLRSAFYDVDGFRAGRCTVGPLELEALGPLAGRSLLHLQCHFGLDTLSLARLGANATGVDYSAPAIDAARRIRDETGIAAEFVCADVYALDRSIDARFDLIYASHGVLIWLPQLAGWARQVAARLAPGGRLYLIDEHPLALTLAAGEHGLRFAHPYFPGAAPMVQRVVGSYADRRAEVTHDRVHIWIHPVSELVNALVDAGLEIVALREYPWAAYKMFPGMVNTAPRQYRMPDHPDLPYLLAIEARRRR